MATTTSLTKLDASALLKAVDEAWNAGDAAELARWYTDDGRLIDPMGGVSAGRDQLERRYAEVLATLMNGTRIASTVEDVRALGDDLAILDGTQIIHNVPTPDGQRLAEWPLHLAAVIRREGDVTRIVEARPYAFSQL